MLTQINSVVFADCYCSCFFGISCPFISFSSFIWHYHSSGCSHSWDCHLFIRHYRSSFIWLLPLLGLPFIHHYGAVSILLSPFSSVCHLSPVHLAPSPIILLHSCGFAELAAVLFRQCSKSRTLVLN